MSMSMPRDVAVVMPRDVAMLISRDVDQMQIISYDAERFESLKGAIGKLDSIAVVSVFFQVITSNNALHLI